MSILKKIFLLITLLFISFFQLYSASADAWSEAWDNAIQLTNPETIPYCNKTDLNGNNNCGLNEGISNIQGEIDDIEDQKRLSEYIQDLVEYALGFISLIAVIYIIYAGFNLLVAGGENEEKTKKTKSIITYVVFGMIIIWLAYPIVLFVIDFLNSGATPNI